MTIYELGKEYQAIHIPLEEPVLVQHVVVRSDTGQSRPLLTNITVTHRYEDDDYRVYTGVTTEGMPVGAQVKTFKNTQWHEMFWTPRVGTQLTAYNIFDARMNYEGDY